MPWVRLLPITNDDSDLKRLTSFKLDAVSPLVNISLQNVFSCPAKQTTKNIILTSLAEEVEEDGCLVFGYCHQTDRHFKIMMIQHVPQAVDFRWPSKLIDPIFPACPEPVSGSPPFRTRFNHLI